MNIDFHRLWKSYYKKLRPAQKDLFRERVKLFLQDPHHALLNNHSLHGSMQGFRSITVGGALRAVFRPTIDPETPQKMSSAAGCSGATRSR